MWVAPAVRGQGLAGQLLARLEELILAAGRREALLDTNSTLTTAVGLYESRGYRRVPDYNGNPDADVWFAKPLIE
jgi:ribosomal protein S18 acetylase RimI-like enzyme